MEISIQKADQKDLDELYALALDTPELRVSATHEFMERDEFASAITNPNGVFLVARAANRIIGFVYSSMYDVELPPAMTWGCLVYLVVIPEYRKQGIAKQLTEACLKELKQRGMTHVYGWAKSGGGIIKFMEKHGFTKGHEYVWMDRKI